MISVIVPIYNVSQYLSRCIESIINQTYSDIELLLIDDGSTDNSGEICDYFARIDERIRVIHNENQGQAAARNCGIDNSRGEYIAFIDSDDYIADNMFEILVKEFHNKDVDIVCCDVEAVDDSYEKREEIRKYDVEYMDKAQALLSMSTQSKVRYQVWNKIIRRELIGNIRFKDNQKYEEIYFERMVLTRAHIVAYVNAKLYYYLTSRPGNTNSYFHNGKLTVFSEIDDLLTDLNNYNIVEAIKNVIVMRQMFAINLSIEADAKKIDKEKVSYIKEQLRVSNRLCKDYHCGNKYLSIICLYNPSIANKLRSLYHKIFK